MKDLLDAFWRAAAYCLHPRVIALSLMPLLIASGIAFVLAYFFWEPAVAAVHGTLEHWSQQEGLQWLNTSVAAGFRMFLAPMIMVALSLPVIVALSLLLVATMMTPSLTKLVANRRFAQLERKRGAGLMSSVLWSLGCTLLAMVALVLSIPLWLVPPLVLVIPPLIWGWLTCQAISFDVLAEHASTDERRAIMREHRWQLLAMGVVVGYLGAAPSMLWAASALTLVLAPLLIPISVWLYTLVFAFSSLWFAHYALAALHRLRMHGSDGVVPAAAQPAAEPVPLAPAAPPAIAGPLELPPSHPSP